MRPEAREVLRRYEARSSRSDDSRYSILCADVLFSEHETQRAIVQLLARYAPAPVSALRLVDVGCGGGGMLLDCLRLGFSPENLCGIELIPSRAACARRLLPPGLVLEGDALDAPVSPVSQDIVAQFVVFSSLLDEDYQEDLAQRMWSWLRPGGGILWYDLAMNNPRNHDVVGIPLRRVAALFPSGRIDARRITLAAPVARIASRFGPGALHALSLLPFLRTHLLCWIRKP